MRYDPRDEERREPFAAGEYEFEVQGAQDKTSRGGNDMVELRVRLYAGNGATTTVYDYLVSGPKTLWKVRQFCESVGVVYGSGDLDAALLPGRRGRCVVVVERAPGFEARNKVAGYVPAGARPASAAPASRDADEPPPPDEDSIPF